MQNRALLVRIERAEQAAKAHRKFSPDCICFPQHEPPFFCFPIEAEVAAKVKCPLHGERIGHLLSFIYVSKWRRKAEPARRARLSEQYQKAWNASFPADLWQAEEDVTADGTVYLKLKDGTKLLAYAPSYPRQQRRVVCSARPSF